MGVVGERSHSTALPHAHGLLGLDFVNSPCRNKSDPGYPGSELVCGTQQGRAVGVENPKGSPGRLRKGVDSAGLPGVGVGV